MKKYIVLGCGCYFLLVGLFVFPLLWLSDANELTFTTRDMDEEVERYRPMVAKYAQQHQLSAYIDVLMAILMQESGGKLRDVMQASESAGLPPNAITDPEFSIHYGVIHFKNIVDGIKSKDIKAIVQGYNYGIAWCEYINKRGGKWTQPLADAFAREYAKKYGWETYGDKDYVPHVFRYVTVNEGQQTYHVSKLLRMMRPFVGKVAYEFGARDPTQGKVDCSGLVEYCFRCIGIDLSGTASTQYQKTSPIAEKKAQVGDLVFFETYKAGASHVGVYVGQDQFINANAAGVEYSSLSTWRNLYPFLGFRRVIR